MRSNDIHLLYAASLIVRFIAFFCTAAYLGLFRSISSFLPVFLLSKTSLIIGWGLMGLAAVIAPPFLLLFPLFIYFSYMAFCWSYRVASSILQRLSPVMTDPYNGVSKAESHHSSIMVCLSIFSVASLFELFSFGFPAMLARPVRFAPIICWALSVLFPLALMFHDKGHRQNWARRLNRFRARSAITTGPFVLLLRRFSGFSDHALLAALPKLLPQPVPIVLLVPNQADLYSWDALALALATTFFRQPASGMTMLSAPVDNWETTVCDLATNSTCIIFDVSDDSASIRKEFSILEKANCIDRTIFISNNSHMQNSHPTVFYKPNWIIGFRRVVSAMALGIIVISSFIFSSLATTPDSPIDLVIAVEMLALGIIFLIALFVWSFRPMLGFQSEKILKLRLADLFQRHQ